MDIIRYCKLTTVAGVLAIFAPGCSSITQYTLDTPVTATRPATRVNPNVLVVATPAAAPPFASQDIIYTGNNAQRLAYDDSRWQAPPPQMLASLVAQTLAASGAFQGVRLAPAAGNLRLSIDIIQLQHELTTRPGQVRLTLRAKLIDIPTEHVLGTQLFEALAAAPSADAAGAAQAANRAVARILPQLRQFAVSHAPRRLS